jgi:hypothetical protein
MLNLLDIMVVAGFFLLRIGVPVLVMVGLAYGLKRLDQRWEAEARAMQRRAEAAESVGAQPQPRKPRTTVRVPGAQPQPPWVPPPSADKRPVPQAGLLAAAPAQRCWNVKGCSESQRAQCAAPEHPEVPCWQARFDAEGAIPETCVKCDIFQRYPMM